jgi:transporter family-2 protein
MLRIETLALIVGVVSGMAIGSQGTLNSWAGKLVGPISTGLLVNLVGGVTAAALFPLFMLGQNTLQREALKEAAPFVFVSGALGVAIIAGIAYSLPRIGIAAGLSAIILGQMMVAVTVDSLGLGTAELIPLSSARIAGLALLLFGTWLLLPRG